MNLFLKHLIIAVQCHSFSLKFCVLYFMHLKISLWEGAHRLHQTSEKSMAHTHMHKLKSSWQTEGTPALISLPGLRRAEILRVLCSLGKLVREETGANDRPSWHDMLCSPRATVDSVRAFVTFSTEGRSQWKWWEALLWTPLTIIKIIITSCALLS